MADVISFGCRLNAAEATAVRARADAAGLAGATVFNTCNVTAEAVRQARQAIRRAKRERPEARIVVTGCAAQGDPAQFAAMPEVDLVLGNGEKFSTQAYRALADGATARVQVGDIMARADAPWPALDGIDGHARAYVQVQNGCDHRCTFCVIPFGRGPSRSLPLTEAIARVRDLVERGYPEIVLTGVDITAWGLDLGPDLRLGALVQAILRAVPDLKRLRLSSIDPAEADPELMDAIAAEPRLMPHIHLSLQAGDDLILKRMKRRHGRGDAVAFTAAVRRARPDATFGADIIAGFPTETEDMFGRSLALVEECGLTHLHVFPFSARPGTPAARMPQHDRTLVKERAARLRERGEAALAARMAAERGAERRVLVEQPGYGRTEHYLPVRFTAVGRPADILAVRITGRGPEALAAEPLAAA